MKQYRRYLIAGCTLAASAIAACSEDKPPFTTSAQSAQTEDGGKPEEGTDKTLAVCNDGQALAIQLALNQGEIDEATAALPRLRDAELRAFAQMMIDDHTSLRDATQAAASGTEDDEVAVTPQATTLSAKLTEQSERAVAELNRATDVDATYLERQILAHLSAAGIVEHLVLPSISKLSLARTIASGGPVIRAHTAEALLIQTRLQGACGGDSASDQDGGGAEGGTTQDGGGAPPTPDAGTDGEADGGETAP